MPGFSKPTTTQTPDALLDYWLTRLAGSELRVLLYAVRRTYGFKRDEDAIGLDQFLHGITTRDGAVLDEGIGISRRALLYAIKNLADKGLLLKGRHVDDGGRDTVSTYRLSIVDERHPRAAQGVRAVNTTQVPDEIFDYWLSRLSDAELRVLLYIVRRTLGFKKQADAIKPAQFLAGVRSRAGDQLDDGCGVSEKHLYRAINGLKQKGLIVVKRRVSERVGNLASLYTLVFENDLPGLLRPDADPDPRAHDYRSDEDETVKTFERNQAKEGCNEDGEGVQRGQGGVHHTSDMGVQAGQGEGATRTGRGRKQDTKGYASVVAPQQTDILKDSQQTEYQQTESVDIDIESIALQSVVHHDESDQRAQVADGDLLDDTRRIDERILALVAEFGDTSSPRASVTKATRRWRASGLDAGRFVALIDEAADVVRAYRPAKPMAYFFTTLEDLGRLLLEARRARPAMDAAEPSPSTETDEAWRAVLDDAREMLTAENYAMWFAQTRVIAREGDLRRVAVPTPLHKHWLDQKLRGRIRTSLDQHGFGQVTIDYVIAMPAAKGEAG